MKIISAFIAVWVIISAIAVAQAAPPVGTQSWWADMDREGRGGNSH